MYGNERDTNQNPHHLHAAEPDWDDAAEPDWDDAAESGWGFDTSLADAVELKAEKKESKPVQQNKTQLFQTVDRAIVDRNPTYPTMLL